jgi:adenine-specific DNA-methyltransferase
VYERAKNVTSTHRQPQANIKRQQTLEPLRDQLNNAIKQSWQEWDIPRGPDKTWSKATKDIHAHWWEARIARQKEIDSSISAKAESELLYDKPYDDKSKVRVAGPFTVEPIPPPRPGCSENDNRG